MSDSIFRQKSQNDATRLTNVGAIGATGTIYTYQATDGTIVTFRPIGTGRGDCFTTALSYQCAYPASIVEPDGTRYSFEYETSAFASGNGSRLRAVRNSSGYALVLDYAAGVWSRVSKACLLSTSKTFAASAANCPVSGAQIASYTYASIDNNPALASATMPDGNSENFSYVSTVPNSQYEMKYFKSGYSTPWMTNRFEYSNTADGAPQPIVVFQNFADGQTYTYFYDRTPMTSDGNGSTTSYQTVSGGRYSDALGRVTAVEYDFPVTPDSFNPPRVVGVAGGYPYVNYGDAVYQVTPGPARIVDPLSKATLYDYCDPNVMQNLPPTKRDRCLIRDLQSVTDPEGNVTFLKHGINNYLVEVRRKAKIGSGLPDIVETASYDGSACSAYLKSCVNPISTTDAKGQTTNYTYSPDHGGMLTETLPAEANGVRPQKRYEYTQRYAWVKNASGGFTQETSPIWLKVKESTCRTSAATGNPAAACAGGATDEIVTNFEYETGSPTKGSNLLLTGMDRDRCQWHWRAGDAAHLLYL